MKKYFPVIILIVASQFRVFAQPVIPFIKASSKSVDVRDGADFMKGHWVIMPEVKKDIYYANRCKCTKRVSFYTDIDSISFTVQPNQTCDFAILLNGKDTAYTQISTKAAPLLELRKANSGNLLAPDTISFEFGKGGKVYLKGSVNNSESLDLMFDLGSNQIVISKDGLEKNVNIQFNEKKDNAAFGGSMSVQNSRRNAMRIGSLIWDSVPVVQIDNADGDGIVGYNAFDGRTIELDYDKKILVVHHQPVNIGKEYQGMELRFRNGLPFIKADLVNGKRKYTDYFEFDGGSNGSLWLNQAFAAKHNLYGSLEKLGTTTSRGLGGSIKNQTVLFPQILIGGYELANVPVHLELPSAQAHLQWGIFGMDVLKRFNVIIDFQKDSIYLKPNSLFREPYNRPFDNLLFIICVVATALLLIGFIVYLIRKGRSGRNPEKRQFNPVSDI